MLIPERSHSMTDYPNLFFLFKQGSCSVAQSNAIHKFVCLSVLKEFQQIWFWPTREHPS